MSTFEREYSEGAAARAPPPTPPPEVDEQDREAIEEDAEGRRDRGIISLLQSLTMQEEFSQGFVDLAEDVDERALSFARERPASASVSTWRRQPSSSRADIARMAWVYPDFHFVAAEHVLLRQDAEGERSAADQGDSSVRYTRWYRS